MADVSFRGGSSGGASTPSSATHTVDYPVGLQADDVVFLMVDDPTNSTTASVTGFTELDSFVGDGHRLRLFQGTGFSGSGSWTITYSAAIEYGQTTAIAWSGADDAAVLVGSAYNASVGSPGDFTVPALTTVAVGETMLVFWQKFSVAYPASTTPTFAERYRGYNVSYLSIDDQTIGSTGTVAGVAADWNHVISFQMALPEATPPPTVPQNLVASAIDHDTISLTWDAFAGATGYDIERDGTVIVADHPTNSYTDEPLSPGVEYCYRVRAVL